MINSDTWSCLYIIQSRSPGIRWVTSRWQAKLPGAQEPPSIPSAGTGRRLWQPKSIPHAYSHTLTSTLEAYGH